MFAQGGLRTCITTGHSTSFVVCVRISHVAREADLWGSKRFPRYLSHSTLYTMSRLLLKPRRPSCLGARTPRTIVAPRKPKVHKGSLRPQMHFHVVNLRAGRSVIREKRRKNRRYHLLTPAFFRNTAAYLRRGIIFLGNELQHWSLK